MTRFLFSFSFLLLSLMMGVRAQNLVTDDGFEYTINTTTNQIIIEQYTGNSNIISVPSEIEGKTVYRIRKLFYSNNSVEEVFIPKTIGKFLATLISEASQLTNIVIGCDPNSFNETPFNLTKSPSFKNLIIDGSCKFTSVRVGAISTLDRGTILVKFKNETVNHSFTIFAKKNNSGKGVIDYSQYTYFVSSLEKLGYSLENIEKIDFRKLDEVITNFEGNDPTSLLPAGCQVIDKNGNIYYNIDDLADNYSVPTTTFSGLISYSRSKTAGWNTVCLPFDVKESDFPAGTEIYQMSSDTEDAIYLSRIEEGTKILAGTPCFIWSPEDAKEWNLSINGEITANIPAGITTLNHWSLQGSFETRVLGTGYYKLNSKGDAFVMTTSSSHTFPFRCYIAPTPNNSSAPARLGMGIDEEATITLVPDDRAPQQVKLYDLMGRPRQGNAAGLFVPSKR